MNDTIVIVLIGYAILAVIAMLIHDNAHRAFLRLQHRSYMESMYQLGSYLDAVVQENKQLNESLELWKRTAAAQDLSVYDDVEA